MTVSDGLPENSVVAITQDYLGFIWFGTQNGLVKYDGYKLISFRNEPVDKYSLSSNLILSILEDKEKNLWIGTLYGLNLYDRKLERFICFLPNPKDSTKKFFNLNCIVSVKEDRNGFLWLITGNRLKRSLIFILRQKVTSD
jgi:ligand-binding sensor domain-containing protein